MKYLIQIRIVLLIVISNYYMDRKINENSNEKNKKIKQKIEEIK